MMAGPTAAMAALLPTKSPAPMMPPMAIIVTCRERRLRVSLPAPNSARISVTRASPKGPRGHLDVEALGPASRGLAGCLTWTANSV